MRLHPGLMLASMMLASPAVAVSSAQQGREALPAQPEVKVVPSKKQQRRWAGLSTDGYRAKGPQAKPRKRSNRLHVSKRKRRAHRRAKGRSR